MRAISEPIRRYHNAHFVLGQNHLIMWSLLYIYIICIPSCVLLFCVYIDVSWILACVYLLDMFKMMVYLCGSFYVIVARLNWGA